MNIVNINFSSINATRNNIPKGEITVNNNIKIDSLEETNMGIDKTKIALKTKFTYRTEYSSEFATIEIKGEVLALADSKDAKELLDKWKKDKSLTKEPATVLINNIMARCSVESILLAKELGLPSPVPLPIMKLEETKQAKK